MRLAMRNFVASVIYSLILVLLSVSVIFLLQAPLASLVYYGFFSGSNPLVFVQNVINGTPDTDIITIMLMTVQIVLSLGFVSVLFLFISRTIRVFLRNEKLIRPYYMIFFFMTSVVPVVIVFLSVIFKIRLFVLFFIIAGVFTALNAVLIIFSRKIFPETTGHEFRKYLFTEGENNA